MHKETSSNLAELEAQIQNLESIKERWEKGEGLDRQQMAVRQLTLELLEGAIRDLLDRRRELLSIGEQD